jgi:valyl-tRNA synthetase
MAKKQMSFAEKAARHKGQQDWKTIKYVKSEQSGKTGSWRFNESYIQLAQNENLDQALTRMQKEIEEMAKEMASIKETSTEVKVEEKAEESVEDVKTEEAETTESKEPEKE